MKSVEERLKALPEIAESTGLQANEELKQSILRKARQEREPSPRLWTARRLIPALCALAVLVGSIMAVWPRAQETGPVPTDQKLLDSYPAGEVQTGDKLALDLPTGSITIRSSRNPSFRSIWAPQTGGNFPLIGVNGRYYRLLTNPTDLPASLLGASLGVVDTYTSEPALAARNGICSNTAAEGETVYAVEEMGNALVAARVNGKMRVFQRVSFGDNALVGRESLRDTLGSAAPQALELSGVGAINDPAQAQRLVRILEENASFLRAGASETNQSLLIQYPNGLVLQLAVNGERVIGCGTWACPDFFNAFQEAMQ